MRERVRVSAVLAFPLLGLDSIRADLGVPGAVHGCFHLTHRDGTVVPLECSGGIEEEHLAQMHGEQHVLITLHLAQVRELLRHFRTEGGFEGGFPRIIGFITSLSHTGT